jgi:hypothetical protein
VHHRRRERPGRRLRRPDGAGIAPIIFCTLVLGIGSVRKAAKVGGLALGYFLVMSFVALDRPEPTGAHPGLRRGGTHPARREQPGGIARPRPRGPRRDRDRRNPGTGRLPQNRLRRSPRHRHGRVHPHTRRGRGPPRHGGTSAGRGRALPYLPRRRTDAGPRRRTVRPPLPHGLCPTCRA